MFALLLAGVIGDAVNYTIGRHVGPQILSKDTRFIKRTLAESASFFMSVMAAKPSSWPVLSPLCELSRPFVAGIALMNPTTFFFFNIIGCVIWVVALVSAGLFPGQFAPLSKQQLQPHCLCHYHHFHPACCFEIVAWQNWAKKKTEQDPGGDNKR